MYNIAVDPECMTNLAADEQHAARKRKMADQLMAQLKAEEHPRAQGNGGVFEDFPLATKPLANYIVAALAFPVAEVVRLPTPNSHGPTCGRCPGYVHFLPAAVYYERFIPGEKIPAGWVNDADYELHPLG